MTESASFRRLAALLSCVFLPLASSRAQAAATNPARPVRAWLSVGIGPAAYHNNNGEFGARAALNVTRGRAAFLVRGSLTGDGLDGYETAYETALLGGVRLGGSHFYLVPALGIGRSHWDDGYPCIELFICTAAQSADYQSDGFGFGYDIGLHASIRRFGLAMNLSGMTGAKREFFILALSPEFGRIGK